MLSSLLLRASCWKRKWELSCP